MLNGRWVVAEERRLVWEEIAVAEPGPGEILLQTEASLVSAGTELAIFTGIHQGLTNPSVPWPKYPQAMGYMAVARVLRVGEGVEDYFVGERLLTSTGHASHVVVEPASPRFAAWRLPERLPAHRLVLARMAKTAVTAVCASEVTVAQSVAVVGLGIIGQMALRLFEAAGAWPIVGVDPVRLRRDAAVRGGAVAAVDPGEGDVAGHVRRTLPEGADIVVDATGWAAALPGAMQLACDGGRVVVLGSPRGQAQNVDFYSDVHRRSLRVIGAHDSGVGQQIRERFTWTNSRMVPALIDWIARGKVPVDDLITHHVKPERLPEMYQGLLEDKEQYLGVALDWSHG
jgi:2-desacetyl-2-hydroxyethyl bacteriochlorophyllide A dehydrogenase